ncbi:MAG: GNAT family N-acetyltransferase [Desulfomonilia bacterium]
MIRRCSESDIHIIHEIINKSARVYNGVIPYDRWHEPYMTMDELLGEIADGVEFWALQKEGQFRGVMGIQDRVKVVLIRHAYVLEEFQRQGVGTTLLGHLEGLAEKPILIGTWAAASWAISFYEKNGYTLVCEQEKTRLLRIYWNIPDRQVETSVVLRKE